jgi:hypothetical protein
VGGRLEPEAAARRRGVPARHAGRTAAVALLLLLLLLAVAVASGARGRASIAPAPRAIPHAVFDYLFTIGVVFFASLLLLGLLLRRPGAAPRDDRGLADYLLVVTASALTVVVFLFGLRLAIDRGILEGLELEGREPGAGDGIAARDRRDAPSADFREGPALVLAAAVALAVLVHQVRRRRPRRGLAAAPTLEEQLALVLDETLDDLRAERDARRAVIAAYARMEQALAAHGTPRRPAEAPLEYLGRALRELSVPAGAALDLTELFQRAKFSPHPIDEGMKDEAISALVSVRDDLRAAA